MGQPGLFDLDDRYQRLSENGDPLVKLAALIDFEAFRAKLAAALTRILDASVPSVIGAYEDKISQLESDKLLIKERMATVGRPVSTFDDTLRTALGFLANPCNLWHSERLEDRRAVLKLTFAERLRYKRNEGFRTPDLSLPCKVLGGFLVGEKGVGAPDKA